MVHQHRRHRLPFVQVLGTGGTIRFTLALGGRTEHRPNPRGSKKPAGMFGRKPAEALAKLTTLPRKIPLAKRVACHRFHAQGRSAAPPRPPLRYVCAQPSPARGSIPGRLRGDAERIERLRVKRRGV